MKKIAFRAIYVGLFIIDLLFLIFVVYVSIPTGYFHSSFYLPIASSVALGAILTYCLVRSVSNCRTVTLAIGLVVSIILTVIHGLVSIFLLPKYSIEDAYKIVNQDPAYASELIVLNPRVSYSIDGNPFVERGYVFLWDTVDYRSGSFYIRSSEIRFDQVTGKYWVGPNIQSAVSADSPDIFGMDCVYFEKDKKAQINLHFILEPEKVLHGFETSFFYQYFNESYEQINKNGILYTTRRRPDMDVNDAKDFINDVGNNKLKIQLEKYVSRFHSELGKGLPDPDIIEIKLYGVEIASYQNGGIEMKDLR